MSRTPEFCIVCGSGTRTPLIDFGRVPRTGGFLHAPEEAAPERRLRFDFCAGCGLTSQVSDDTDVADYTHVNRGTERQLPAYADELLRRLANDPRVRDGLVVEVGSNDGTFLTRMSEAGISRLLGVEPSRALSDVARARGHRIENVHLDAGTAPAILAAHGAAAAVVCRHTLEHVPEPAALLEAMGMLLAPRGLLLIEVPDSTAIFSDLLGYELWDEHLTYFCEPHLQALARRAGFVVESSGIHAHRGSRNIVLLARLVSAESRQPSEIPASDAARLTSLCRQFEGRWRGYSSALLSLLADCPGPVFAAGASHPQTNFLHFTGLAGFVDALLDDDPLKVGRYVALARPARVLASADLDSEPCGTLLLTGFGYAAWMNHLREMASRRGIRVLDPLAVLDEYRG